MLLAMLWHEHPYLLPMNRLQSMWLALLASLWFLPVLMLCLSVVAGVGLVELHGVVGVDIDLAERWPRLFGAGAEGARGMLSAIATSMITVAGVVFSITVVALSMAASQYSPRILSNFMSDRATQAVLGAFVSIFAYCLVVLRTIRGADEGGFVPSLAILGGFVLAFAGVLLLIYFVHHVALSIQVPSILERIAEETNEAIERLFPDPMGSGADTDGATDAGGLHRARPVEVCATHTGYLVGVDSDALLAWAERQSVVVEIVPHMGDFVVKQLPMLRLHGGTGLLPAFDRADTDALLACFGISRQRTVHQDAAFGLQQIVDIAMKALSPGINDPSTATICVDQLSALLASVANRQMPSSCRATHGVVRVVAQGVNFESMLSLAFDAISEHADQHIEVHECLACAIGRIATVTTAAKRHAALARQLDIVAACAERAGIPEHRRVRFDGLVAQERARIDCFSNEQSPQPA